MMTITLIKIVLTIINNDNNKNNHNHTNTDSNDGSNNNNNNNNNNSGDDDDDDNHISIYHGYVKKMGYLRSHGDLADGNSGVQTSHGQVTSQFPIDGFFRGKITHFP